MIPLFLFLFGLLGLLAWLPLTVLSALALPFCSSLGALTELLAPVERLVVGAGVFRAFWFGGWVGVLRGVLWAELSRLGGDAAITGRRRSRRSSSIGTAATAVPLLGGAATAAGTAVGRIGRTARAAARRRRFRANGRRRLRCRRDYGIARPKMRVNDYFQHIKN